MQSLKLYLQGESHMRQVEGTLSLTQVFEEGHNRSEDNTYHMLKLSAAGDLLLQ